MDPGGEVARDYGIYGPPESFFVDREGIIRGRQIGQLSPGDLERQLATIL
jgi:cytochrome c biogenesis protein CcmG/thiol:disulfide interchange protein DsbE